MKKNISESPMSTVSFEEYNLLKAELEQKSNTIALLESKLSYIKEELQNTKEDLKFCNERLQVTMDNVPMPIQLWSKDKVLIDANLETARIFGFEKPQDFIDNFTKCHPEYQPNGEKSVDLGMRYLSETFEKGYLRKPWVQLDANGQEIQLEITLVRCTLYGELVILSFLKDQRELHQSVEKLRQSTEYSQIMLDQSPLGTLIWDQRGNLVHCNKALAITYGLNESHEFIENFHKLVPEFQPDGVPSIEKMQKEIQKTFLEGSTQCSWMGKCIEGKPLPTQIQGIRTMHNGEFVAIGYLTDMRKIEENVQRAKIAEKRAEAILNGIPMGIHLLDADFKLIDCNDKALELMNIPIKQEYIETLSQYLPEYQPNGQETALLVAEKMTAAKQHGYSNFELVIFTADNEALPTDLTVVRANTEYEEIYIGYVFDLRETKKLLSEVEMSKVAAEKSAMAKSEFLANMSHEIRTPMNGILGLLHILSATKLDAVQANYLHKALFSTKELLRIINDILDFSKIEAGKLEMEVTSFTLYDICLELESLLRHVAEEKGIEYTIEQCDLSNTTLLGDPLRLKQVLLNLVSNAIKFTSQGSVKVHMQCTREDESKLNCSFKVVDTGIGLSEEQTQHLFTAFMQADTSVTRKYGGTGLGLAISKNIVEMMQGQIWVESEVGQGSTFCFNAKFEVADEESENTSPIDISQLDESKSYSGHLLLVEDNQINQIIAEELLQSVGYTLDIANNGQEAIDMLNNSSYDLVLMDIQMPIMDGLTATQAIRQNSKFEHIPIVAMSAHAMTGDKEKSLKSGMNDHITKPIVPNILYATLDYWINKK